MARTKTRLNRSLGGNIFIMTVLLLFAFVMVLPLIYAVSNSLKPMDEFFIFPPRFLVRNPTLQNFSSLFRIFDNSKVMFSRYVFNTLVVSVIGTAGQVLLSSMCAYAISKLRFPGRNVLFRIVVLALMFNSTVTTITNFLIIEAFGMLDTYFAVILPSFSSTLGLYLMKQFIDQMIPDVLIEAARIDGAREAHIFFRIVFPVVKPAWLTLIIFAFQAMWNAGASPYVYSEKIKTVNYALSQILAGGVARSGAAAAGTVLTMIVPILLFVFTQSNIVETMATSGMKE